jgi:hypothetical protein
MSTPPAPCGTHAAYTRHLRRKEPVDEACRAARTEYQRNRRQQNPEKYALDRAYTNAQSRAAWRLAARYRDEFRVLVAEELELPPPVKDGAA